MVAHRMSKVNALASISIEGTSDMGLKISFGQTGDATQTWVNAVLAQKLVSGFAATAGAHIDINDKPTTNALENVAGTDVDLYRNVVMTDFTTTYTIQDRWGIAASRVNGIATFDLKSGWNTVKNASVVSDVADQVILDGVLNFDADYSAVTSGINSFEALGVKRGNYLGGSGVDLVSISLLNAVDKTTGLTGWNNNFNIATGGGNDVVTFSALDMTREGIAGDTTYTTGEFAKSAIAADTSGRLSFTYVDLGAGNDSFINSSEASDNVWGGLGNDNIVTGAGRDFLDGGAGNDFLSGGADADRFHFGADWGRDTVTDFSPADGDKLEFDAGLFASSGDVLAAAYQNGADVWIDQGADQLGNIVILKNMMLANLVADDIVIL